MAADVGQDRVTLGFSQSCAMKEGKGSILMNNHGIKGREVRS
jgi:hypothetical protein